MPPREAGEGEEEEEGEGVEDGEGEGAQARKSFLVRVGQG